MEMPLIAGEDLGSLVERDGPLDASRAVDVVEQVAAALDTAHRAGLVHRDVKPSNILITDHRGRDFAYLIDFGIARNMDGTKITESGQALGTLAYMAPERFAGAGDLRGDVYALACVLHHVLTGQAPFVPPEGAHELGFYVQAHLHHDPPQPSRARSTIPVDLDPVIARGMAKDPDERCPSATALATAAREALTVARDRVRTARPPVAATPAAEATSTAVGVVDDLPGHGLAHVATDRPSNGMVSGNEAADGPADGDTHRLPARSPSPSTPPRPRRRRWVIGAAVATAITVATALIWVLPSRSTSPPAAAPAVTTAPGATPVQERRFISGSVDGVATAQFDGRPVVISGGDDDRVQVRDLATGALIGAEFTGHTDDVNAVATAQLDGRPVVISGGADGVVRVWDLETGAPVGAPVTGQALAVYSVATAQLDGRTVVISGGGDGMVRVSDLATGVPVGAGFTGHTGGVYAVATAQLDGRQVVISAGTDKTVRVWDLATREPVGSPFTGHTSSVFDLATAQLDGRTVVVSAGGDRTVRVSDLATGAPIGAPFTGHTDYVISVATAELDGRTVVVSSSKDGTVRLWDLAARTGS